MTILAAFAVTWTVLTALAVAVPGASSVSVTKPSFVD
jgi:hypothetical protein